MAGKKAVGVAIGLAERYTTEAFKKSVRRELTDAMVTSLRSAAPPAKITESPKRGPAKKMRTRIKKARAQRKDSRNRKKQSKILIKDQQVSADAAAVAMSSIEGPSDDWRTEFATELSEAASHGLDSEGQVREAWEDLIGSRAPGDWANAVSVEFALQLRARKKLEFLVAQLDKDDERARMIAGTAAITNVATALYGISASLLIGAGGIALAVALH